MTVDVAFDVCTAATFACSLSGVFTQNQIRLMIGGALGEARGDLMPGFVEAALKTPYKIRVPLAPAEGLVLESQVKPDSCWWFCTPSRTCVSRRRKSFFNTFGSFWTRLRLLGYSGWLYPQYNSRVRLSKPLT